MTSIFLNLGFAACLVVCAYLSYRSITPPNPPPAIPYENDHLQKLPKLGHAWKPREWAIIFLWAYHISLVLLPDLRSSICLHPEALDPDLFTWNTKTFILVLVILVAAPFRLLAYAQLGPNFTFLLARPKTLVVTGIYRYVQHPSYTALLLVNSACIYLLFRTDGAVACWLPSWIIGIDGLSVLVWVLLGAIMLAGLIIRVRDEEEMMRKGFGQEWETYHNKTKRFIPGIF